MPRRSKAIRRPKPRKRDDSRVSVEAAVTFFMEDPWAGLDAARHPILASFKPAQREKIVEEYDRRFFARRQQMRAVELRKRLEGGPESIADVVVEMPELRGELTREQEADFLRVMWRRFRNRASHGPPLNAEQIDDWAETLRETSATLEKMNHGS